MKRLTENTRRTRPLARSPRTIACANRGTTASRCRSMSTQRRSRRQPSRHPGSPPWVPRAIRPTWAISPRRTRRSSARRATATRLPNPPQCRRPRPRPNRPPLRSMKRYGCLEWRGSAGGERACAAVSAALALALVLLPACRRAEKVPAPAPTPRPAALRTLRFDEKTEAMGIHFTHVNGARGDKWMPETMGGGVAVLDYDGDGRPDLLFVSSCYWPSDPRTKEMSSSLVLYRNEGVGADGLPHFRNVTREAGLEKVFYGMGASVGDYDNDGRDDVYVTALGGNHLFHNVGGRFEDVTKKAGVADSGWSTSAAWFDFDGDGLLDLFVCRYVDWSPQ